MKNLIPIALALCLAACDDSGGTPDAPVVADGPAGPDAMVGPDAGPDAPPLPVDASDLDAGPGVDIAMACARVCGRVFECFMEPPDPTCEQQCAADLADCSQPEIEDVYDCGGVACSGLKMCVGPIPCVSG